MTLAGVSGYSSRLNGHKNTNIPYSAFKFSATEKMGLALKAPASSALGSLDVLLIQPSCDSSHPPAPGCRTCRWLWVLQA